ncbi:hypothetical protein [Ralstonia mannitolilytica]|uniref:hypothetical protein n=1 Tax=Ralstonia mannitolilytica TaxID=105219 RepID=UPI001C947FAA|nr:hypothetical protein [Ralstonia mannitolilytica]MBY4717584.1 hypothetical protein [Ralstonia mannitolilytica]
MLATKINNWLNEELENEFNDINEDFDEYMLDEAEIRKARLTRKQYIQRDINTFKIHMNRIGNDLATFWENHRGIVKWGPVFVLVVYAIQHLPR